MKNESQQILNTFSRKLVNSRFRVAPKKLIEQLKAGEFGYTTTENAEPVAVNDFVLVDDFATLIDHIKVIFNNPLKFLKKESVLKHVENASNFNNSVLQATIKDEKLWKIKNGKASPEFVHSFVYEDNYAIYENKFICFVVDSVLEAVNKKINELALSVETVNKKMSKDGASTFTTTEYVDFMVDDLLTLITNESATVGVIRSLIRTKKLLISLKNKEVYRACKKDGKFNPLGLKATNILTKNDNYRFVYNFYLNYFNREPEISEQDKMYLGYVTVNLLGAFDKLGFTLAEDTEKIGITNSAGLKFAKIEFNKAPFTATLTQYGEDGILVTIKENADNSKAKYLFRAVNSVRAEKIEGYTTLTDLISSSQQDGIIKTFIVNDIEQTNEFNGVYVVPTQSDALDVLSKAVKSCFLLAHGSSFMHDRYCPVCGSNLLSKDDDDVTCTSCGTIYHVFESENKDYVWFKDLPKLYEYSSEKEIKPDLNELALTDDEAVRKTFMQKLADSEQEVQNYYNAIKHELLSYKNVNSRVSRSYDRFNLGRKSVAKIGLRGKTLALYLALSPEAYVNKKYFAKNVSVVKKYQDTPTMIKIKSQRGLKHALELISVLLDGVAKNPPSEIIDYVLPEIPAEQLKECYLKKSFAGKLCQLDKFTKDYYSQVKNTLIEYKKVNSRLSFNYESFNVGRKSVAKLNVKGKTLVLYLALDPTEYVNKKYFAKNVGGVKKYQDTPTMLKVKSPRGTKHAIELINKLLNGAEKHANFEPIKYADPIKSDAQLLKKGLAKLVKRPSSFFEN